MEINGKTEVCGLIGNPVEHTLSPVIHNTLAELMGINMVYLPFPVSSEHLQEAVKGAEALHIKGLNVTVPYKEKVLPWLVEVDEAARVIGAVNTLEAAAGGYKGYNTDMPGLYRAMISDDVRVDGAEALILGAGGVARAAAFMLADKAGKITILNRTPEKAWAIAKEVNRYAGRQVAEALEAERYRELSGKDYLVIQATNLGMYPDTERALIEDQDFYRKVRVGYELIYNPFRTRFMQMVEAAGGRAFNGLKLLLYQGIIAFEIWNHCEVTKEQADLVYGRLVEKL